MMRHFLSRWLSPGNTYQILDLCTGAGDIPRVMVDWARRSGVTLRVDAVDANESTLEIARRASEGYPEVRYLRGNALHYTTKESYDLVTCSLCLHHFSEDDAITLLRRCRILSNRFVLVGDLERTRATLLGVRLLTAFIYRLPMTRTDAIMSAHRAFSYRELRGLAEAAGWENFGHMRFLFCRQAVWLDERSAGDIPAMVVPEPAVLPCPV